MGIGLLIAGQTSSDAAGLLGPFEAWFRKTCPDTLEFAGAGTDTSDRPALFVRLHPCAEDVEISAAGPDRLVVCAKTSTAGPGYHRYLCDLLKAAGAAHGVEWLPANEVEETGDEAEYFHTGDGEAVDLHMRDWASGLARQILEMGRDGYDNIAVSMPTGRQFEANGAAVTPMGPRDRAWFEAAAEDPDVALDLFPWWSDGFDAGYFLGRALARMWMEVSWRPPVDGEERALLRNVADHLASAWRLDPARPYPWREWREILAHLGDPPRPEVEAGARGAAGPLVGYRRRRVRITLPGAWSIRIPGSLKESMENDGRWSAWEPGRTVWFTSFHFTPRDGSRPPDPKSMLAEFHPGPGERIERVEGGLPGVASFGPTEENGRALWRLEGRVALQGHMGVCDIFLESEADRAWAVEIWRSLRHADP